MDLKFSIERQRQALIPVVAGLYIMIGLVDGGMIGRMGRPLHRAVLALLRPAEAAVRRLIIAVARELKVEPPAARSERTGRRAASGKGQGKDKRKTQGRQSFQLFDPPWRPYGGGGRPWAGKPKPQGPVPMPRIRLLDSPPLSPFSPLYPLSPLYRRPEPPASQPQPAPPQPVDTVSAVALCRRLKAITDALADLPGQAMRYARWRAKPVDQRRPKRDSPLRLGKPPGFRRRARHEVHDILEDCHWLAREALKPDTS